MIRRWDIQAGENWWLSLGFHVDHTDPSLTIHLPGLVLCFGRCKQPGFRHSLFQHTTKGTSKRLVAAPNTIGRLSDKTNNATYSTPTQVLNDALSEIGKRGAFKNGRKLLILALDDTNENFHISFIQAGMKMSECVAVCDVAKNIFKKSMGYS